MAHAIRTPARRSPLLRAVAVQLPPQACGPLFFALFGEGPIEQVEPRRNADDGHNPIENGLGHCHLVFNVGQAEKVRMQLHYKDERPGKADGQRRTKPNLSSALMILPFAIVKTLLPGHHVLGHPTNQL